MKREAGFVIATAGSVVGYGTELGRSTPVLAEQALSGIARKPLPDGACGLTMDNWQRDVEACIR